MSIASLSNPILKPLPIGNSSIISAATIFSTECSYPHLSISSRSIKLHLSCSSSFLLPSLSLNKNTLSSNLVPLVAQTSDWAQQNGESTFLEEPHEFETLGGSSDWGPAGEEVTKDRSAEEPNESFQDPPEEAKLFVGNLPYEIDAETLAGIFEQAGIVISSDVIYNRDTQQSRGFGFVTMSTVEEAEKAVEMFHHYDLDGRPLTVNKAAPRGTQPVRAPRISDPAFRIYVGNLPWNVDNAYLEQIFSEHGKVVDARVVYERETNRSRGFGFVTMSNETEVNDAIAALNGQSLDGREIRVSKAEERSRRGFV